MITFKMFLESLRKPDELRKFRSTIGSKFKEVDSRDVSWQQPLTTMFARYGFKTIGTGKYGAVFGKDNHPYVIKVFMKDTAYLRWLNFAKMHQNNPFVPKIKGKVVKITDNFMAVRLEKLTPSTSRMKYWDEDESNPHVSEILDFFDRNARLLDLHMGNIMARGDQPVIVDPFYNYVRGGNFSIDPNDTSGMNNILVRS